MPITGTEINEVFIRNLDLNNRNILGSFYVKTMFNVINSILRRNKHFCSKYDTLLTMSIRDTLLITESLVLTQ